jgi:NAD(P)-dependent dehydrogenase (short-subunit alcohol dehydrogenase family)
VADVHDPSPRVTVVTGAGGGLGLAIVKQMMATTTVVAVDRSEQALEAVPPSVVRETANVTDPDDVVDLFDRIEAHVGCPWSVINAVGGFRPGEVSGSAPDDYRMMLDLNLNSSWWISRAAAAGMRRAGRGAIVLVAARNGLEPVAGAAAYSVSKGGVVYLTRVLDAELRGSGIRVNAIVPSLIDTAANRATMPDAVMKHAVAPEAIARVIDFLVSDDAAPVVGAVVPVYGL